MLCREIVCVRVSVSVCVMKRGGRERPTHRQTKKTIDRKDWRMHKWHTYMMDRRPRRQETIPGCTIHSLDTDGQAAGQSLICHSVLPSSHSCASSELTELTRFASLHPRPVAPCLLLTGTIHHSHCVCDSILWSRIPHVHDGHSRHQRSIPRPSHET